LVDFTVNDLFGALECIRHIIDNISGDFFASSLHIPIGINNWIIDDCVVYSLRELIPLVRQLIALEQKPLLRTRPPDFFFLVNDSCDVLECRFLSGCNRDFFPFGPFITADSRNSDRTRTRAAESVWTLDIVSLFVELHSELVRIVCSSGILEGSKFSTVLD
jgi:hypothetical protein